MTNRLHGRIAALEQAAPEAVQTWVRIIVPYGLTPEDREAFVAVEKAKHPAGTGFIFRVLI